MTNRRTRTFAAKRRVTVLVAAVLVLMAGIVSSLGLYIMDILSMLGG